MGLALAQLPPGPKPGTEVKPSDEAKKHFGVGVDFLNDPSGSPNYEEAYREFYKAYEISPSWKILPNLGLCAMMLERNTEAIEAFERFLEEANALGKKMPKSEKEKVPQVEKDLNALKTSSATVTVTAVASGAIRLIDQRVKSTGQLATNTYSIDGGKSLTLKLKSGHHTIIAKSEGKEERWEVDLQSSQSVEHNFSFATVLSPAPLASASAATPVASAPPPEENRNDSPASTKMAPLRKAGIATAAVGGALMIGGVIVGVLGKSQLSDLESSCLNKQCPSSKLSERDSIESKQTLANVFLVGGGIVAAGGITMIVLGKNKPESTGLMIAPSVTPGLAGLVAAGRF